MANAVNSVLETEPRAKILTFTGNSHASLSTEYVDEVPMAGQLKDLGLNVVTLLTVGGRRGDNSSVGLWADLALLSFENFLLPCRALYPGSSTPYDWILHLSQTENAGYSQLLFRIAGLDY